MLGPLNNIVQQFRFNTVNFFMRRSEKELWKTITSVSKSGQKKGRRNTRQIPFRLEKFYRVGNSPMGLRYGGLNTFIQRNDNVIEPLQVLQLNDDEAEKRINKIKLVLGEKGASKRTRFNEKLHPLERGFSGKKIVGQKLGSPPPLDEVNFDEFQTYCLEVKRTSNMVGGLGRLISMKALVFVGNGKGLGGYAVGKAPISRTFQSIVNGMKMASRRLFYVELLENRTIYQDFYAECRNTKVFAQRRPPGFGLTCHPRLQKICEAIGIKDIYVKVEGSTKNYIALTHAFITGLLNQETHQQLAERKGLHVVEFKPTRQFYPEIVASPLESKLKTEDEIQPSDRLELEDFYGEGRYPLKKPKKKPFYINTPGHIAAEWRKHPFRNQENAMIRLLADGVVTRWTRDQRKETSKKQDSLAKEGVIPIPRGIGLSDIFEKKET
ncbi:28S ribosomal protein S5, mitochondrial [Strongyloides ratti]|uniref:Small ribosomal subunit protein uS5m n=1 Tax=Strongyloides ratti TaxID=34506 RepID=A0A090LLM6_STRRB|nr:28S ribosomal protein S5, mitochondrial [Strongyloides ratti]CEF69078.1 28S ribosomal protein S5, mitochondrial [Strongyloides ratti]